MNEELVAPYPILGNYMGIVDLGLVIEDYLIISDLHLGYEASLNRDGVMVPKFQFDKIVERIMDINACVGVDKIIINGDLKHNFGKFSKQEWKEIKSLIEFLEDNFLETIIIKGNHDNFLPYLLKDFDIPLHDSFLIGDVLVAHGHSIKKLLKEETRHIRTLVLSHEHPCLGIRNGERVEKIKCFLKGNYESMDVIVMPSFNFISEGSDILQEKMLISFLDKDLLASYEVFCVEDFKVLPFGRVGDILVASEKFR